MKHRRKRASDFYDYILLKTYFSISLFPQQQRTSVTIDSKSQPCLAYVQVYYIDVYGSKVIAPTENRRHIAHSQCGVPKTIRIHRYHELVSK